MTGVRRGTTFDRVHGAAVMMDPLHYQTHLGNTFQFSASFLALAGAANADVLLITSASEYLHIVHEVATTGNGITYMYEGTTVSANGVAVSVHNKNRNREDNLLSTFYTGPTVTTLGTLLHEEIAPGGTKDAGSGTQLSNFDEYILKPNTNYLFRITNTSGGVNDYSIHSTFYRIRIP